MGGLGYIRPELEPNLDRPRDRFQSDHRTFPRFRFRQSGRADLARAISHRGSDSILSQPTFPPLFPALLRTRCLRKTEGNCSSTSSSTSSSPRKGPLSVLDIPFRVAAARKGVSLSLSLSRFPLPLPPGSLLSDVALSRSRSTAPSALRSRERW